MLREIVVIDDDKCNGCGNCVPGCPEGALQIIDGKARLVSDLLCDGLGACIGECPVDAITVEKREAVKYEENKVMANISKQGENTIIAHLKHLKDHGETVYYNEAVVYLKKNNMRVPDLDKPRHQAGHAHAGGGCPGSRTLDFSSDKDDNGGNDNTGKQPSELKQWPIQLHLVSPNAPYFQKKDLLLAADCVAFSMGNFHKDYLKGKSLAIACPKLDEGMDIYVEKLTSMIDDAMVNTITVMIMEVPCCGGLLGAAKQAVSLSKRKVPIKVIVIGLKGDVLSEQWA
jgi:NAD-dependent dihydropyrimidine dehydrogenase PreA subunit